MDTIEILFESLSEHVTAALLIKTTNITYSPAQTSYMGDKESHMVDLLYASLISDAIELNAPEPEGSTVYVRTNLEITSADYLVFDQYRWDVVRVTKYVVPGILVVDVSRGEYQPEEVEIAVDDIRISDSSITIDDNRVTIDGRRS